MKIGILTLHSQVNYGGVLQCWAMESYLLGKGYDVVVLNHRMQAHCRRVKGAIPTGSLLEKLKFLTNGFAFRGHFRRQIRAMRTERFIHKFIKMTKWSFFSWDEVPVGSLNDIDVVIVGSDQVWNGGNPADPLPYLFEGCKERFRAIAYAPSFGMPELTLELRELFRHRLSRFEALG